VKRSAIVSRFAVVAVLAVSSRAFAGGGEGGDTSGGTPSTPPPATVEVKYNPHHKCSAVEDNGSGYPSTIWDLWRCAVEGIDPTLKCSPGPTEPVNLRPPFPQPCVYARSDYKVTWLAPANQRAGELNANSVGVNIVQLNNSEPYRLMLKEDSESMNWTKIWVNRPYLAAMFGTIVDDGTHTAGTIEIKLNGHPALTIQTQDRSASDLNMDLYVGLSQAGFTVAWDTVEQEDGSLEQFITVLYNPSGQTITSIEWKATDKAIKHSDIRLEPDMRLSGDAIELPL